MAERGLDEFDDRSFPIHEDMALQRRTWRIERIGWVAMGLIVLAALLGLFSQGPLSSATIEDPTGRLAVDYQRFERSGAGSGLTIRVASDSGEVRLRYSASLAKAHSFDAIEPRPIESRFDGHWLEHVFNAGPDGLHVVITTRASRAGLVDAEVSLVGGPSVAFTQLVYP